MWLPPDADLDKAMELIADEDAASRVGVAEADKEGVRLSATTWAVEPRRARQGRRRAARALAAFAARARTILNRGLSAVRHRRTFHDAATAKVEEARRHTGRSKVLLGARRARDRRRHRRAVAVGYVLAIAASAPDLAELKPADKGQLSVVYAADGSRLGFIQSDVLRRVVPWRDIPVEHAPRHRRHRGRALLQARRRGPQRDRPRGDQEPRVRQDGAGRLDDHAAARPRAVHQGPEARLRAQDPRGQARLRARGEALEDLGAPQLPELGAVRDGRRPHGDRRRGRGGHVLRQARQEPPPLPVGAARRPAAGAVRVQPVPEPARGPRAAQRRAPPDGRERVHHPGRGRAGRRSAASA